MANLFHDIQFPINIANAASGGARFKTDIVQLSGGGETRNRRWQYPLHSYDVSYGVKKLNDVYAVKEFHLLRGGRAASFRFKDWDDFKSLEPQSTPTENDQLLGVTDGSTADFQLVKIYSDTITSLTRTITLPVNGTVLIAVNNVLLTETTDYDIDYATGIVTLKGAHPATTGFDVEAGFEFDVRTRFDQDFLPMNSGEAETAMMSQILLLEQRV